MASYTVRRTLPAQGNRYAYAADNPVNNVDPTGEWQFRWDHWYAGTVYLNRTETEWVLLGGELAEGLALIPVVGDALAIGDAAYAVAAASAIALGGCLSVMTTGWPGVYYDEESGCY